jgi:hypothetical protein
MRRLTNNVLLNDCFGIMITMTRAETSTCSPACLLSAKCLSSDSRPVSETGPLSGHVSDNFSGSVSEIGPLNSGPVSEIGPSC